MMSASRRHPVSVRRAPRPARLALAASLALSLAASLVPVSIARADAPLATASMDCEHATEPGRVRCTVEARAREGVSIQWGDVVIAETEGRVAALRGRVGPEGTTARDETAWRWALALVARERGASDVRGRVRLVLCQASGCAPFQADIAVRLRVGAAPRPAAAPALRAAIAPDRAPDLLR